MNDDELRDARIAFIARELRRQSKLQASAITIALAIGDSLGVRFGDLKPEILSMLNAMVDSMNGDPPP